MCRVIVGKSHSTGL